MKRSSPPVAPKAMPDSTAKRLVELGSCLEYLEKEGLMVRILSAVSSKHELAGIARHYEGKKCVLFERVKGSKYPVFMGMLWNRDIVGQLFGMPGEKVPFEIAAAIGSWHNNKKKLPSPVLPKGPANEVVEENVDLYKLPIPVHAMKDGGRYFDCSVVVVKNPETGISNTSIHRMMVTRKDRLTFLIDPGRHLG
ncbi:MAG: UbiD family decarboxylase, partial [Desulfobacterales bacterium]